MRIARTRLANLTDTERGRRHVTYFSLVPLIINVSVVRVGLIIQKIALAVIAVIKTLAGLANVSVWAIVRRTTYTSALLLALLAGTNAMERMLD
ncbi:hypothetical protein KEJ47_09370 [Candidatus Bathyarchaeota archaeon]|nr:hypothetical protein [Candidatus Bathyarchaeota archaeon]